MYHIVTDIEISGSPGQIWHALTDFKSYPDWNPVIRSIKGTAAEGQKIRVYIAYDGFVDLEFSVVVDTCIKEKELRWLGRLLFPAMFTGDHYFLIEPVNPIRSRLIHGEHFSGLLKPIFWWVFAKRNARAFNTMNQALKEYVEGHS